MFDNPVLPGVSVGEMRGVAALLSLIGTPRAAAALAFLTKLSAEKDAAVGAAQQAATDRAATEAAKAMKGSPR